MTESDDTLAIRDIVAALLKHLQTKRRNPPVSDITTRIHLQQQVDGLKRALDAAVSLHAVPIELCHTLRAPTGTSHIVELAVGDQLVRAVINPLGKVDPEGELAVWRDLLDTAAICVYPGEQLRRMQPAILAVRLSAEILVVNTEHPRAIVRAAMKLLQPGAMVPLPVAWMVEQARTRPGRTGAAVAGVVIALTLTLVQYSTAPVSRDHPAAAAGPSVAPSPAPATDAPTGDDPTPAPPPSVSPPARPPTGAPRSDPPPDQPPDQDAPAPPDPAEPSERPRQDENPDDEETPDRPAPTTGPTGSSPPPGEGADPTPRDPSPPQRPSSPSPAPSAPVPTPPPGSDSPAPKPPCRVLDVDVNLPVLNVDVCV